MDDTKGETTETPETIAELLQLAKIGRERLYTQQEIDRVGELAALTEPVAGDLDPGAEAAEFKGHGALAYWTTLIDNETIKDEAYTVRNKNVSLVSAVIVPHIMRVVRPHVENLKKRDDAESSDP